jgi:hypothetical protein
MKSFDDEIARHLKEALASGELASAPSYGKRMDVDAAWLETPEALRMPMKILKDAGVTPPEIEWFHERARLRAARDAAPDESARRALQVKLNELEARIALRVHGTI